VDVKMVLEVSSQTGVVNIGGIEQPTIGQRHIEHEMRLGDGQINLVGGFMSDTESEALSGYPWLGNMPVLKYLFGSEVKKRDKSEIVFAIIPHIVRAETITEENLRLIDIGTGSTIDLRQVDQTKKPGGDSKSGAKPAAPGATSPKAPPAAPTPAPTVPPPAQ